MHQPIFPKVTEWLNKHPVASGILVFFIFIIVLPIMVSNSSSSGGSSSSVAPVAESDEVMSKRIGCDALFRLAEDIQAGRVTDTQLGAKIEVINWRLKDTSFKRVSQDLLTDFESHNNSSLQVNMLSLVALCSDFKTRGY